MSMPVQDWQFWVVTACVALAAAWLLRGVLPIPFLSRRHQRRKHERRVNLTVSARQRD